MVKLATIKNLTKSFQMKLSSSEASKFSTIHQWLPSSWSAFRTKFTVSKQARGYFNQGL